MPETFDLQPTAYSGYIFSSTLASFLHNVFTHYLTSFPLFFLQFQKLLSDASRAYEAKECPKGLEVLLTWRYARLSNGNRDILEIRIGGILYSELGTTALLSPSFVSNTAILHYALLQSAFIIWLQ